MYSEALVTLALNFLSCSQKELASRLGVSPTQISKWKKGEHMSHEMEEKIREIVNIGEKDPSFVLWAGSLQEADKWEKLIRLLAKMAMEEAETGYNTYPLEDETDILCWQTFYVLREIGVDLPKKFPDELYFDYETADDEQYELLMTNKYSSLIYAIYLSLNDVYGFYAAYVDKLIDDLDLIATNTETFNIEPCLMELAACKIAGENTTPKFIEFKKRVKNDYEKWINIVKDSAFRAGIPLRAELLNMVYESHEILGHEAEAESLGFNSRRIHPDIYMNELLYGMRVIHQILPAIVKKLGIEDEINLDPS